MTAAAPARRGRRSAAAALTLAVLVAVAGCGGGDEPAAGASPSPLSPLDDCAALAAPPAGSPPAEHRPGAPEITLPEVTLPCFTGDEPVALADLTGPAVVNLWASWCRPCRRELPVLQEYAEQGGVHVVGVVTEDTRERAAAFARDAGITFPALYDRDGAVDAAVPGVGLPATLFVDGEGQVRHVHREKELDRDQLAELANEHLGVTGP